MDKPLKTSSRDAAALFAAALFVAACGQGNFSTTPDPYAGFIDGTVLDTKFEPALQDFALSTGSHVGPDGGVLTADGGPGPTQRCPFGPCYPVQTGLVESRYINFYSAAQLTTLPWTNATFTPVFPVAQIISQSALTIATADCSPGPAFDRVNNAYSTAVQFPIFTNLPFPSTGPRLPDGGFAPVMPIVATFGMTGLSGDTCNDIKTSDSTGYDGGPAKFGGTPGSTATYEAWAVVDETQTFARPSFGASPPQSQGWYKDLQFTFMNGGPIPTDTTGEFLEPMDGVLVHPPCAAADAGVGACTATVQPGAFSKVTDKNAVILPFAPGETGYSPIVLLHDFHFPAGGPGIGFYDNVCFTPANCGPTSVCVGCTFGSGVPTATFKPSNTIVIVAAP